MKAGRRHAELDTGYSLLARWISVASASKTYHDAPAALHKNRNRNTTSSFYTVQCWSTSDRET